MILIEKNSVYTKKGKALDCYQIIIDGKVVYTLDTDSFKKFIEACQMAVSDYKIEERADI